jgi:hypothetical protein
MCARQSKIPGPELGSGIFRSMYNEFILFFIENCLSLQALHYIDYELSSLTLTLDPWPSSVYE